MSSHKPMYPASSPPAFELVLIEPEIPTNTGNIGRTAAATGSRLHVVHPIGFDMGEKARRRAGLDYWDHIECREHDSWHTYLDDERPTRGWVFSAHGGRPHWDATFKKGDHLVFGGESSGLAEETQNALIDRFGADALLSIPMAGPPSVRSLNLATAVAIAAYEGLRQLPADEK